MKKPDKPCHSFGYCPYGKLVEYFPLHGKKVGWNNINLPWIKVKKSAKSCSVFGHDCPVYHVAEQVTEENWNANTTQKTKTQKHSRSKKKT